MKLKVKRIRPDAKLPEIAHPGEDFGYDVFACIPPFEPGQPQEYLYRTADSVILDAGCQIKIPIGWAMELSAFNYTDLGFRELKMGLIAKQPSGLASKRMLDVKAGVIDAGYRNEIVVLLYNYGTETQYIKHHDKVAQLVPMPIYAGEIEEVDKLSESGRGLAGWGSGHKS